MSPSITPQTIRPAVRGSVWILFCALALTLSVACGPIGPFAGRSLSGPVGPSDVSDWSFADEIETAQLETRPDAPHSVNTWFAQVENRLYVPTSMILGSKDPSARGWVGHVATDPRVRIRLGDTVFERVAKRVEDPAEFDAARAALEARYDIAPADRDPERIVWIFRLDARTD